MHKHWHLETKDNVAWLTLDKADTDVNTLDKDVLSEFDSILTDVEKQKVRCLVIKSAKSGFIAGADINQFLDLKDVKFATELIKSAQLIFDRLEALSCHTIAVINGFCLGGGCELAIACNYRIMLEDAKIGLPEVKLGIHPGWGGTIRTPKLVGIFKAMELMLSGRVISAREAKKSGLVDECLPERHLESAIEYYINNTPKKNRKYEFIDKFLNLSFVRPLIGKVFKYQLNKKVKEEHYPAPFKVVENWVHVGLSEAAYAEEANSVGKLIASKTAQNLVKVFFLQEKLKKLGKVSKCKIKNVHVVGAGVMGGEIAAWCALKGFNVTLQDISVKQMGTATKGAAKIFSKKLKLDHLVNSSKDRMILDVDGNGVKKADIIIEAVTENLDLKRKIFDNIKQNMKKDAIIATNTSTLPIEKIAEGTGLEESLIGVHFFNPVSMMPLVEVIKAEKTKEDIVEKAVSFVGKIGKLPLIVKSSPGFLVNRVLLPYMVESIIILEEGVNPAVIDQAALNFGMPMGPIELADTVGIDVCLHAATTLKDYMGGTLPNKVSQMVDSGNLGRKTGRGFYNYKNQKPIKDKINGAIPTDIQDRLVFRMLNESVACIRENIVETHEYLDAGMIFGAGFSPFLGGPMNYIIETGAKECLQKLDNLSKKYGDRFKPDDGWKSLDG